MLTKGQRVADLGCWPGGWMQYALGVVGEGGRRIHRAVVGMPADVTLQLVVSPETPLYAPQVPVDVRVQVVAPDAPTLVAWRSAIAETRS